LLSKVKKVSFLEIIKKIKVYSLPSLKVKDSFFKIDNFFYTYPLIKKLRAKNNLFIKGGENKLQRTNLKRFSKKLREELLVDISVISSRDRPKGCSLLRRLVNEQDFKKL